MLCKFRKVFYTVFIKVIDPQVSHTVSIRLGYLIIFRSKNIFYFFLLKLFFPSNGLK